MGRNPYCSKEEEFNIGAWTAQEDKILKDHIEVHGEVKWNSIPRRTGLKRRGKSCRLRWLNYLRPDIKRGNITHDEEDLIIRLHRLLGNRWSLIAGRLTGRTDNEIKNYWNTNLAKRTVQSKKDLSTTGTTNPITFKNPTLVAIVPPTPTHQNINPLRRSTTPTSRVTRSKSDNSLISIQSQLNDKESQKSVVTTNSGANPIIDHESSPLFISCSDKLPPNCSNNHPVVGEDAIDNDMIDSAGSISANVSIADFCDFNKVDLDGAGDDGLGTIVDGQKFVECMLFCESNEQDFLNNHEEMDQGFWGANTEFRSLTSILDSDQEEWSGSGDLDLYFQA